MFKYFVFKHQFYVEYYQHNNVFHVRYDCEVVAQIQIDNNWLIVPTCGMGTVIKYKNLTKEQLIALIKKVIPAMKADKALKIQTGYTWGAL